MNTTEQRLTEALKAAGGTLGPQDVPDLVLPARRRSAPMMLAAAAATLAVIAGGTLLAFGRESVPVLGSAGGDVRVSVFLCTKTSSNPACDKKDATQEEKDEIKKYLMRVPGVRKMEYVSKSEAYLRFRKDMEGEKGFLESSAKSGDIPDSFQLTMVSKVAANRVLEGNLGRPGVDQIVMGRS
ncbi:permease-like cell division protein FtsX [Actinomadura macrotermitis]|uniref:FtsX extracellular domain-containing protein n=1 Tax=Actinomadura macrotermitis TaxID=2585200 RepID=A0A7K0BXI7_9ACTN|nr:permease-like cell division protein FtsX [Actinomadura macrotermitis]MQY05898.1 hypothetical protein [Actinomadura macrotermitis]